MFQSLPPIEFSSYLPFSIADEYKPPVDVWAQELLPRNNPTLANDFDTLGNWMEMLKKGWENVIVVAKSGGDYTTIKEALSAVSGTTPTTILVMPGDYNEGTIYMKAKTNIVGMTMPSGSYRNAYLQTVRFSGRIIVPSTATECGIANLTFPLDTSDNTIDVFGQSFNIVGCYFWAYMGGSAREMIRFNTGANSGGIHYCILRGGSGGGKAVYHVASNLHVTHCVFWGFDVGILHSGGSNMWSTYNWFYNTGTALGCVNGNAISYMDYLTSVSPWVGGGTGCVPTGEPMVDGLRVRTRMEDGYCFKIKGDEILTAHRTLTIKVNNADRILTVSGNATIADWFDQAVKTTSQPSFTGIKFTNKLTPNLRIGTTSDPPTASEITALFGSPSDYGSGVIAGILWRGS